MMWNTQSLWLYSIRTRAAFVRQMRPSRFGPFVYGWDLYKLMINAVAVVWPFTIKFLSSLSVYTLLHFYCDAHGRSLVQFSTSFLKIKAKRYMRNFFVQMNKWNEITRFTFRLVLYLRRRIDSKKLQYRQTLEARQLSAKILHPRILDDESNGSTRKVDERTWNWKEANLQRLSFYQSSCQRHEKKKVESTMFRRRQK